MARNFTVADLIVKGRRACDQESRDVLSASEWQEELSTVYGEFHGILVDAGVRMFESSATITAASGTDEYALPSDFLTLIGIDYDLDGSGQRVELENFLAQERNALSSISSGQSVAFALIGDNVKLYPPPVTGQTYYNIYVPQPTNISTVTTSTEVDVVTPDGESFFKWRLAEIGGIKEESDMIQVYERKAEKAKQSIIEWAMQRELYTPKRRHVYGRTSYSHSDGIGRDEGDWY